MKNDIGTKHFLICPESVTLRRTSVYWTVV